ncbi:MAG: hypothetical protein K2N03_07045 [Muribaculaceae bacterium]|nr:hypothetical protein [Muribaculaceae bacterium]
MTTDAEIQSIPTDDFFKIGNSNLISYLLMKEGLLWIIILGTIVLMATVLCIFVDIRFLAVSMLCITVIAPLGLAYFYFYYALKPLYAFNVLPHKINYSQDSLSVIIRTTPPPLYIEDKTDDEDNKASFDERKDDTFRTITIAYSRLGAAEYIGSKYYTPIDRNEGVIITKEPLNIELYNR